MYKSPDKVWERRCVQFNHDWLKNEFIPALARFLNCLDDEITTPEFEIYFTTFILPEWSLNLSDVQLLVDEFEIMMSPKCLFETIPLKNCSEITLSWLPAISHLIWLSRCDIRKKVSIAKQAILESNQTYLNLNKYLQNNQGEEISVLLRLIKTDFKRFLEQCQNLGCTISDLPRKRRIL